MQTIEPENGPYVGNTFGAKCSGTGNVPEIFFITGKFRLLDAMVCKLG
jgi:hypothetical protein